jgi:hypothetical protein
MIRSFSIVTTAAFLLLAGCGSPEMAGSEANADNSAALLDAKEDLIGSWVSPSCGDRTYARRIRFELNSSFAAQDLVSPCPPDVVCIWSGIVYTDGRYLITGDTIKLIASDTHTGPIVKSFPEELLIDPKTNVPVEVSPEGERCPYSLESR